MCKDWLYECKRMGCGKFEDECQELSKWKFNEVGLTETHLRDDVQMEGGENVMIEKGHKVQEMLGGG